MHGLSTNRVGEGHVARDDPNGRPGMSAGEIVDRLGWLANQGVTISAVPIPPSAASTNTSITRNG